VAHHTTPMSLSCCYALLMYAPSPHSDSHYSSCRSLRNAPSPLTHTHCCQEPGPAKARFLFRVVPHELHDPAPLSSSRAL
jgi:hypothetical protein